MFKKFTKNNFIYFSGESDPINGGGGKIIAGNGSGGRYILSGDDSGGRFIGGTDSGDDKVKY